MSRMTNIISMVTAASLLLVGGVFAQSKLIYYGWNTKDTQYIRDNYQAMQEIPLDGIAVEVALNRAKWNGGDTSTGNKISWHVLSTKTFTLEQFQEAINDMKVPVWTTFTHNFLPIVLSSQNDGQLNWFDEARWQTIMGNFQIVSTLVREMGLRGVLMDPEGYGFRLFSYPDQKAMLDKTFAEYAAIVKDRGRSIALTLGGQVDILMLLGYSYPWQRIKSGYTLETMDIGLMPAFMDGLLEGLLFTSHTLTDGFEYSYAYKRLDQFQSGLQWMQDAGALSSRPTLFTRRGRKGFGLWMDNGNNPAYFTPAEWEFSVGTALDLADTYVWIYSQHMNFFPPNIDPAYLDAMRRAKGE